MSWAEEELEFVNLGDTRLNQRLKRIVEDLASYPEASVPQASRDAAAMQGTYDFWSNRHIKPSQIQQAHAQKTAERAAKYPVVLDLQDTTKLDFTSHRSLRKKGVRNPLCEGLWVHTSLCATTQGVPLGVLHQKTWTREKAKKENKEAEKEKESQKWLESVNAVQKWLPSGCQVITIGDREADIYELLTAIASQGGDFIIRAFHNRTVEIAANEDGEPSEKQKLKSALAQKKPLGKLKLSVPRAPSREAREAILTLKVCRIKLSPPRNHPNRQNLTSIEVTALLAAEENPPSAKEAISWLLLTSLTVKTLEEAKECLKMYSFRWLIERFHYTLKSGCHLEKLQLEKGHRLERALATYAIVAWRLLWLTYEARVNGEQSAKVALSTEQWQSLYCGKVGALALPVEVPSLGECVRWIAELGGFLGRKRDGEPGVKVIWRGLKRLRDLARMWQIFAQAGLAT